MTLQAHEPKFRKIFWDMLIIDQDQLAAENEEKAQMMLTQASKKSDILEKRPETPWMQRKENEVRALSKQLIDLIFAMYSLSHGSKMISASGGGSTMGDAEGNWPKVKDKIIAKEKKK